MSRRGSGPRARRLVAAAAVLGTAVGLLIAAPSVAGAAPTPPPNPSDQQLSSAQSAKTALASKVGALSGQIAQAKVQLQQLEGARELAEQKVALAISKLQQANQAAAQAKRDVQAAAADVDRAHDQFVQYVQATYMSGTVDGTAGTLLTATDPSALLEQSSLEQYQQEHQANAIGALERATIARSNADAKARLAVRNRKKAASDAQDEKQAADNAVAAQQAQEAALNKTLSSSQTELDAAQSKLADLNHQRAQYVAWKAEQARLERIRQEKLRQQRLAEQRREKLARERAQHHGDGGSSAPIGSGPSAPSGGSWTPAKGQQAARRAKSQLNTPYAWAGGGVYGPSQGVCDASNGAPFDCHVTGYDCSGLAMYAWGQGWAHYAATQYTQAGSVHPSADQLRPGDLIFWSFNGHISGIHHVAIYIGGGQIVEAPYSGGYVQTAPLYEYGGFFGATRPLT